MECQSLDRSLVSCFLRSLVSDASRGTDVLDTHRLWPQPPSYGTCGTRTGQPIELDVAQTQKENADKQIDFASRPAPNIQHSHNCFSHFNGSASSSTKTPRLLQTASRPHRIYDDTVTHVPYKYFKQERYAPRAIDFHIGH